MNMGLLVQIIMGGGLLIVLAIGIIIFAKTLLNKNQGGVIKKFILVESLLTLVVAGTFILLSGWPTSFSGLIICSIGIAFLANLPIVLLIKLYQLIFRRGKGNQEQKVT
jgi:hypothetical protein